MLKNRKFRGLSDYCLCCGIEYTNHNKHFGCFKRKNHVWTDKRISDICKTIDRVIFDAIK